jgi:hypothetical protein
MFDDVSWLLVRASCGVVVEDASAVSRGPCFVLLAQACRGAGKVVEELCRIGRQLELLFSFMRNGVCVLLGCVVDDEAYADKINATKCNPG